MAANGPFDVSIIVVNRNTRELLEKCLSSIQALPDDTTREVIVIDNDSSDGSAEMVQQDFPDAQLIRNETNTGFAFPNNQGIARSRGRYVLLLNSDTVVKPHALERMVDFMDHHPTVGACGPQLLYPDGRLQPSCFNFHSPWRCFCDMTGLSVLFSKSALFMDLQRSFDHTTTAPTEALMGAALLVRREVIDTVGVLDERFRIHCNEIDWCHRMKLAGWDRYFVAEAVVVHELGGTMRHENAAFRMQGEMLQNLFDYHRKYYGVIGLLWFRFWSALGFSLRGIRYSLMNFLQPDVETRRLAVLSTGIARAALVGDAHRFPGAGPSSFPLSPE